MSCTGPLPLFRRMITFAFFFQIYRISPTTPCRSYTFLPSPSSHIQSPSSTHPSPTSPSSSPYPPSPPASSVPTVSSPPHVPSARAPPCPHSSRPTPQKTDCIQTSPQASLSSTYPDPVPSAPVSRESPSRQGGTSSRTVRGPARGVRSEAAAGGVKKCGEACLAQRPLKSADAVRRPWLGAAPRRTARAVCRAQAGI